MTRTSWILFVGAAAAAVGVTRPWDQAVSEFGTFSNEPPSSNGSLALVLFGLAAAAVAFGWRTRFGSLRKGRVIGLAAMTGLMTFVAGVKFDAIFDYEAARQSDGGGSFGVDTSAHVTPGLGLWLWMVGVVAFWVVVVRSLRSRPASKVGES